MREISKKKDINKKSGGEEEYSLQFSLVQSHLEALKEDKFKDREDRWKIFHGRTHTCRSESLLQLSWCYVFMIQLRKGLKEKKKRRYDFVHPVQSMKEIPKYPK